MREYCCTAVEIGWQLCASRAFSASNGSTNPRPSEVVALGFDESCQSYVRGAALSREPPKLEQAQPLLAAWDRYRALLPLCDTRCWRAELGMRHADLLREATAVIATPASAPCMILQCGAWYGCVGVWVCVWWWDERCDRFNKRVKLFRLNCQSKESSFATGSASRNSQSKKIESNKPFFDVRKLNLGFSRKRPFSTDKSDCIRNGLRTSAVSSTNFRSILIFASCVVGTCNILCG